VTGRFEPVGVSRQHFIVDADSSSSGLEAQANAMSESTTSKKFFNLNSPEIQSRET
jgi:hypothetical protein